MNNPADQASRQPSSAAPAPVRFAGVVTLSALAIVIASRWSFTIPGTEVPQTAQTLAVVVVGALLGSGRGSLAVLLYLLFGAVGLPVFADGRSGLSVLSGPTAGYLAGFVAAAALAGRSVPTEADRRRSWIRAFAMMILGHAAILGLGWAWLASKMGATAALDAGVRPFLLGAVVKSLFGAASVTVFDVWRRPARD